MQYFGHIESGTGAAFDEAAYQEIIKVFTGLLDDPVFRGFDAAGEVRSSVQEVCPRARLHTLLVLGETNVCIEAADCVCERVMRRAIPAC
jgi:hypothetical protein